MDRNRLIRIWKNLETKIEEAKEAYTPLKCSRFYDILINLITPIHANISFIEMGIEPKINFEDVMKTDALSIVTYLRLLRQHPNFRESETQVEAPKINPYSYNSREYIKQYLEREN